MNVVVEYDRLDETHRSQHEAIDRLLSDGALMVAADAQGFAPVDTGRLRAAISTRKSGTLAYEVYNDTNYAVHQEYGTRYQPGKAFMRPSYEKNRQGIIQSFKAI